MDQPMSFTTCNIWDAFGLTQDMQLSKYECSPDIIIGIVDSGIRYDLPCFSDAHLEPLPDDRDWLGGSEVIDFECNRKIVGAKVYAKDKKPGYNDIYDHRGHGTAIAFIIAGGFQDINESDNLVARGGVPNARIAMYKVHSMRESCTARAINDAVRDGVDVINLSMGPADEFDPNAETTRPSTIMRKYSENDFSLATLNATVNGILCVVAAGNYGEWGSTDTVVNYMPWELCIASANRHTSFNPIVKIGPSEAKVVIQGYSSTIYPPTGVCPLILEKEALVDGSCKKNGKLDPTKALGKIILYMRCTKGASAKAGGAKGFIALKSDQRTMNTTLPAAYISAEDVAKLQQYITDNQGNAVAEITTSVDVIVEHDDHPVLLTTSSRGPNNLAPNLVKPDACAPGCLLTPSIDKDYPDAYQMVQGTSAATALVTALAAALISKYPNWSVAAIKSAFMTTAKPMKKRYDYDPLGFGNGFINPEAIFDPGLIYDIENEDYVRYLRGAGFSDAQIHRNIPYLRDLVKATKGRLNVNNLNLPSFGARLKLGENCDFERRLTSVSEEPSTYRCKFEEEVEGLHLDVYPNTLSFERSGEVKEFQLSVIVLDWSKAKEDHFSSYLVWEEDTEEPRHSVRSHVLITLAT